MNTFKMQCVNYLLVNEWVQDDNEWWMNCGMRLCGLTMYEALEAQIEHDEGAEKNDYPE